MSEISHLLNKEKLRKVINQTISVLSIKLSEEEIDKLTSSIFRLITTYINPNKRTENIELAIGYLNSSKKDLEASKILFADGIYCLSVYHLQQSVEKITKACGLGCFLLDKKDLRSKKGIHHKTPLAFIKMIEKEYVKPLLGLVEKINPNIKTNTEGLKKLIAYQPAKLARWSIDDIAIYLTTLKEMHKKNQKQKIKRKSNKKN